MVEPLIGMKEIALMVVAVFATLVGKILWDWLNGGRSGMRYTRKAAPQCKSFWKEDEVDTIVKQVGRLAEQHDRFDGDGVPVWYVRQGLETKIEALTRAIYRQTDWLKSVVREMKESRGG